MQIAHRNGVSSTGCLRHTKQWVDIWRIDGLLTRKLSEMGVLCGKLQFLLHRFSYPSLPFGRRSDATWRGVVKNSVRKMMPETRDSSVVLSPFSAIFGLILTHVLKTEWRVAAACAALRPAAMQIAHRSGVFLVRVPAPHQALSSGSIYGESTVYYSLENFPKWVCCAENSNSCCTGFPIRRCLWQALRCDVARGSQIQRSHNHPRNTRF